MAKKEVRPVDRVLETYSASHAHPANRKIQYLSIPVLTFGLLGLIWSIPFPHLEFLGRYNGFVNWASFVIAFSIYYYYRLSPVLSYGALLLVFAYSAGIVGLEKLEKQGFAQMWHVCVALFAAGMLLQSAGYAAEGKLPSFTQRLKNWLNAPLWLFAEIFKKAGIKV